MRQLVSRASPPSYRPALGLPAETKPDGMLDHGTAPCLASHSSARIRKVAPSEFTMSSKRLTHRHHLAADFGCVVGEVIGQIDLASQAQQWQSQETAARA